MDNEQYDAMVFQRRVGRKNIISRLEPGFALIRVPFSRRSKYVPNKTLYTTDTSQRGGSGDAGVEGGPVHVHPSVARRAKQVVPKCQNPIRLIALVRLYVVVRFSGSFYALCIQISSSTPSGVGAQLRRPHSFTRVGVKLSPPCSATP